jgi:hypothetical protein
MHRKEWKGIFGYANINLIPPPPGRAVDQGLLTEKDKVFARQLREHFVRVGARLSVALSFAQAEYVGYVIGWWIRFFSFVKAGLKLAQPNFF